MVIGKLTLKIGRQLFSDLNVSQNQVLKHLVASTSNSSVSLLGTWDTLIQILKIIKEPSVQS